MFRMLPTLTIALLFFSLPSAFAARKQSVEALVQKADLLDAQKTYGAAAEAYELALKVDGLSAERRDTVEYRFAVALGKAQRWDRALEVSLAFVQRHRGTVWEPRGLYWLGRLYVAAPHRGWRVGKRLFRGENAPADTHAEKPEYRTVLDQDMRNARDAFEAARILYPRYRSVDPSETHDEVQLDFDLARVLSADRSLSDWAGRREWLSPSDPAWQIDPNAA